MYIMHRRLEKNAVAFGIMSNKVPRKQIVKNVHMHIEIIRNRYTRYL